MRVIGNRILVVVDEKVDVESSIEIAGQQKVPMKATIISKGNRVETPFEIGEQIIIQNGAGEDISKVLDDEQETRVITDRDVISKVSRNR